MRQNFHSDIQLLAGAAIVVSAKSSVTVRIAGAELSRCLYLLTGRLPKVIERLPEKGTAIILDRKIAAGLGVRTKYSELGDQGYHLIVVKKGQRRYVVVDAFTPTGMLYGAYGLLEMLGMGFYAGGETFPDLPAPVTVPSNLDRCVKPAFSVRGNMLHYNFLCGCTTWGLDDYKFYFDQLARMRCNMLLMHWYDNEPGAAYEVNGEYLAGGVTPNTLTKPWGALSSLRTSEFSFGTGKFFDEEIFSSPMGEDMPNLLTEIKRTEIVFRDATRYARDLGIEVAAGFEAPRTDPTDPSVCELFKERVRQFAERNPYLTRFALWEHESGGCIGSAPPSAGSAGADLLAERRDLFAYLGNEQRVWEAIRFGRFAEIASDLLTKEFPYLKLVLVGWGGDRWMRFADYCLAYDKILPPDVAFTCHDNIDASIGPQVSTPWGQLPQKRERWALPWVEGDIDECMVRQPNVESLGLLAPDALKKGCQGLLTLQWRTRDVEEETGFIARFAWDTSLTPDGFYRAMARHAFGPKQEKRMAAHLATLQRLGARWTGVRGTVECGPMVWTGWKPHFPFEVNGKTAAYLAQIAEAAAETLAEIPTITDTEAAFHLAQSNNVKAISCDSARPGVTEFREATEELHRLEPETDPKMLRTGLARIEETIFTLRPRLVFFGMSTKAYIAVDRFLIAIHHVCRNAGAQGHMTTLRKINADLARLSRWYTTHRRIARLERLDYLTTTIDIALHLDSVAMLLADGEYAEQALEKAGKQKETGDAKGAAATASQVYTELVKAGMDRACTAFTRKLTTRCDFGTLATLNVKHLPSYWQTIEQLEMFMPVVPPREIQARGLTHEVWLSWQPCAQAASQYIYRRLEKAKVWTRVNREPLTGNCQMFIDRPSRPGNYVYATTTVDNNGWESPMSHPVRAFCGPSKIGPLLTAAKPFSRLAAGENLNVRIVVLSDREVKTVNVLWRMVGERQWRRASLARRFRFSYHGSVDGALLSPGILEFYVEGIDGEKHRSFWPESASILPWTALII